MAPASQAGWKVFGSLSAILAGMVAKKAITAVWTKTTGKTPPTNPMSESTTWMESVGWAAASGLAMGVARMLATQQAAKTWTRASGQLPPGLEDVS